MSVLSIQSYKWSFREAGQFEITLAGSILCAIEHLIALWRFALPGGSSWTNPYW